MEYLFIHELVRFSRRLDIFCPPPGSNPDDAVLFLGIHTPIVLNGQSIVWGFSILDRAQNLGIERLPCMFVGETDPLDNLALALRLENRKNRYTYEEKRQILDYIRTYGMHISEGERALSVIESLVQDGGSFIPVAEAFGKLCAETRRAVNEGFIDLKTATIYPLCEEAVKALFKRGEALSASERRIAFRLLSEITMRDSLSPEASVSLVDQVIQEKDPILALRRIRFPELMRLEEELDSIRHRYFGGTGISFAPPQNFEGDRFTFSFSCGSARQLKRIITALERFEENFDECERLLHDTL